MNVLLTGGAGYIGSHIYVALCESGLRGVLLDNFSNSFRSVLNRLQTLTGHPVPSIEGDISDIDLIKRILIEQKIDAVIHLAGLKYVGESLQQPLTYYQNNVAGTLNLLSAMRSANVRTLVFSSSASVYGNPKYLPLDEKHSTEPTNPYGRSKLMVEKILSDVVYADSEWKIASLRYFNPVGSHLSGLIGEEPLRDPSNIMPMLKQVAQKKVTKVKVFGHDYDTPDGTGVRDYIHVMDLAEGHLAALCYLRSQPQIFDVFNLGTGTGYSVLEIIKAFQSASRQEINFELTDRRPGDVAACYADSTKAQTILRWQTRRNLMEMCQSAWEYECHET